MSRVFYGVTQQSPFIPAQAVIQNMRGRKYGLWVPAFRGDERKVERV
jgi:hypothetical protein